MSETEIQKMVKDAEMHADDDKKRKEEIEARNRLDNLVYGTEKTLNEGRGKLDPGMVKAVGDVLARAKETLKTNDAGRMRDVEQEVTKVSHQLAEALYRAAGQGAAHETGGANSADGRAQGGSKADEDVIDVDYEERASA